MDLDDNPSENSNFKEQFITVLEEKDAIVNSLQCMNKDLLQTINNFTEKYVFIICKKILSVFQNFIVNFCLFFLKFFIFFAT